MKKLYGLLGHPLGHSFSVNYFTEKFEKEGIYAEYRNFDFSSIEEAMKHILSLSEIEGFNVTIPYKQAVMPYLHQLSDEARSIGAVNVVRVEHTENHSPRLCGYNSDVIGFCQSIHPLLLKGISYKALVLGTGGASKAVTYGLRQMGIEPTIVSRKESPNSITYNQISATLIATHKIIVNCTPVGMYPHTTDCPNIPYDLLTSEHIIFDLVYNPANTLFMQRSAERGATVKNGLEMLHLQAEAAWEIWQNKE